MYHVLSRVPCPVSRVPCPVSCPVSRVAGKAILLVAGKAIPLVAGKAILPVAGGRRPPPYLLSNTYRSIFHPAFEQHLVK